MVTGWAGLKDWHPYPVASAGNIVALVRVDVCDGAHWMDVMKKAAQASRSVESHPNVEKHDVRMGHPARATRRLHPSAA
jgi:hypothetical protein